MLSCPAALLKGIFRTACFIYSVLPVTFETLTWVFQEYIRLTLHIFYVKTGDDLKSFIEEKKICSLHFGMYQKTYVCFHFHSQLNFLR